ncbi:hypothetical protein LTR78_005608 [Recurvomyces mirabilis]|uniref:Uncharacterized protein n=1 Tax=Recurvomyces mirabilis TaxID=574656 RepID=A0AAE0WMM1_9PEZI|nr:hypothetical protein LTR78_005608 [Recurvomyces mirabilis]KAK5151271.1 hypothetical protein LTS14_009441 [Recurvomyces mirabilis]
MSNTQPLSHTPHTGLTDSTHNSTSTSSSAERYRLDDADTRPVLVYRYRGALKTSTQKEICAELDKDDSLRCTHKPIPRGTSYLDVRRHDLYLPSEREEYAQFPNFDSSLASIKVPLMAYVSRMVLGTYDALYIVSPETTPNASLEGSRRVSPSSSWGSSEGREVGEEM